MACRPYYYHPPGQISRWGVVDVGLKCPHSCAWCYYAFLPDGTDSPKKYAGMRRADWKDTDLLLQQVDTMADNGFLGFDMTGGEPSLHPNVVDIVQRATDRGLSTRMITLAQFLTKKDLLQRLLDAGLTDFLFSYHSADADVFHKITGGTLSNMEDAMDILEAKGFQFGTNVTTVGENYKHLPELARAIIKRNVYVTNIIVMNAYYGWADGKAEGVRARYTDIAPYLREAVAILEEEGHVAVNVRYAPMCTMAGLEKNLVGTVGVRYDPHEWVNTMRHFGPAGGAQEGQWMALEQGQPSPGAGLIFSQGDGTVLGRGFENRMMKSFAPQCRACSALKVCDGIDTNYLHQVGNTEFVPYMGDDRGDVLDKDRLTYHPGFVIKRQQLADVKSVIKRLMGASPVSKAPLVTVAVANYNNGPYIKKCLDSLLAQTWKNLEIIVCDDCSTDNSKEVLAEYADRCTILYRSTNSGNPATPHNDAFAIAKGELFMYLDPDDWVDNSYVEEAVRMLQKHPKAGIVYPGISMFGMRDSVVPANPYDLDRLILANFIPCCAMYRREIWEQTGGYVSNVKGADDWNMWVAAASLGYFGVPLNRQLFHYYTKPDGLYEQNSKPNHEKIVKQVVLNNSDLYPPSRLWWAQDRIQTVETDNPLVKELIKLDASPNVQDIIDHLSKQTYDGESYIFVIYRLLTSGYFRPAYMVAKMINPPFNTHPVACMARGLGGILFNLNDDLAAGTRDLRQAAGTLQAEQRRVLKESVVDPTLKHVPPGPMVTRFKSLTEILEA